MSISIVQTANSGLVLLPTVPTAVSPTGSGNLLVCAINAAGDAAQSVASISGGGTWAQVSGAMGSFSGGESITDIWACLSSTPGATTVTMTLNVATSAAGVVWFYEISGCSATPIDAVGNVTNGTGVGNTISGVSLSPSQSNAILIECCQPATSGLNGLTGTGTSQGWTLQLVGANASCYLIVSSTGPWQPQYNDTTSGDTFAASGATFLQAGGTSGVFEDDSYNGMMRSDFGVPTVSIW